MITVQTVICCVPPVAYLYMWLLVVTVERLRDHCSDSHMLCYTCSLFIYVTFGCYSWTSTWSLFRQSYVVFHVYLYMWLLVVTVERLRDHRSDSQMFCCSCIYVFILVVTVERLRDHRSESQMFCCSCIYVLLAPAVTVGERRELWILPPFFFGLFFCL